MKVPTYQTQVPIETARTQAPRMPTISMPRTVPGAFGVDVGAAYERLGDVGLKIAEHLQKMALEKQDREVLRRETASRKNWQNRLMDMEEETVMVDGKEVTRPKGWLLRQGILAEGVTQEFDKAFQERRNQDLAGLSQYQVDKLGPALDNYHLSIRNKLITHEANEWDAATKKETESNLEQKVLDASMIRDEEQLGTAIDDAIKAAEPYYRKYDEVTRKVLNEKIASNMVEAATISTLQNTGDLILPQGLLDSAKDKIAQSTYNDIKSKLAKGYKSMVTESERIRLINRVNSRFDYIAKIADGTLDWANSAEIIRQVAATDPKLAEAMTKNIEEVEEGIELEDESNEVFLELAKDIFTSTDLETISDFLVRALSETKNISRDRLAILVYAARKRAEELDKGESRGFLESIVDIINIQNAIIPIAVNTLLNTLRRIQKENVEGEKVLDIANDEIRKQNLKDRPDMKNVSEDGQEWRDPDGNKAMVYPDGRVEEIK